MSLCQYVVFIPAPYKMVRAATCAHYVSGARSTCLHVPVLLCSRLGESSARDLQSDLQRSSSVVQSGLHFLANQKVAGVNLPSGRTSDIKSSELNSLVLFAHPYSRLPVSHQKGEVAEKSSRLSPRGYSRYSRVRPVVNIFSFTARLFRVFSPAFLMHALRLFYPLLNIVNANDVHVVFTCCAFSCLGIPPFCFATS